MKCAAVIVIISILCKFCTAIECDKVPKNDEVRLKKDMLCSYDKSVRPLGGTKNATNVKVKMALKSYDYLEYSNSITVFAWMVMSWSDEHFKWDPREYGGVKIFYAQSDEIWMPDFTLYNTATQGSCETTNCVIHPNGFVLCVPPCQYTALCSGFFNHWPFDRQNCSLNFGSWINTGEEINFFGAKTSVDTSDSLLNHDWKLLSVAMNRHNGSYACCPNQTFPSLTYNFVIERHSSVYAVYLLVPAIVLVLINIVSLLVPPRGNDRWILIAVSFIGHILYIQQLAWTVPKNGVIIPSIVLFFRDSTVIIAVLILNNLIVRVIMTLQCEVPGWLSSPVDMVKESVAGKLIVDVSGSKMEKIEEVAEDDTVILVEPKVESNKNTVKWLFVATLVDRLVLLSVSLTYFFLIIILIPEDYASSASASGIEFRNA